MPCQYAFEDEAVFVGVINLHVIVARIDHPQARQFHFLVNLLLDDGVRLVAVRTDNLSGEPQLACRRGHQRQVRANRVPLREPDLRARGKQTCAGEVGHAGFYPLVEAGADQLVAGAGRPARQRCTVENLSIRHAHALARTLCRKRPVCERLLRAICSGVPSATIRPPPQPPSGPRSITQSASAMKSRLCSMTTTEWPASTNRCTTSTSRRTSAMCRPMVGSSRMNRFRLVRRWMASGSLRPASKWLTSL